MLSPRYPDHTPPCPHPKCLKSNISEVSNFLTLISNFRGTRTSRAPGVTFSKGGGTLKGLILLFPFTSLSLSTTIHAQHVAVIQLHSVVDCMHMLTKQMYVNTTDACRDTSILLCCCYCCWSWSTLTTMKLGHYTVHCLAEWCAGCNHESLGECLSLDRTGTGTGTVTRRRWPYRQHDWRQ